VSQLIEVEKLTPVEVYNSGNIDKILEKIASDARSQFIDISTDKGRKECASLAYKVAQSKTFLDKMGKALGDDARKQLDTLNAERKKVVEFLDKLKDEIRDPLTTWENAEKQRVAAHENELSKIIQIGTFVEQNWQSLKVELIESKIKEIESINRDWQEFTARASSEIQTAFTKLDAALKNLKKYEDEQAELARFREQERIRIQKERDEQIAREAAEKAKIEAENKARIEAERLAKETERIRPEAEQKAKAEADRIAKQAELERQKVLREKQQAEEKALALQREKELAEKRAKDAAEKAEKDKKLAIEAERARIEKEKQAAIDAEKAREANLKHRAKINNEILNALVDGGVDADEAKLVVTLIAQGKVPHTRISY